VKNKITNRKQTSNVPHADAILCGVFCRIHWLKSQRFPLANIRSSDIGDRTEYVNTILEYQPAGVIIQQW